MSRPSSWNAFLSIAVLSVPYTGCAIEDHASSNAAALLATCSIGGFDFDGPQVLPVAPPGMQCPAIATPDMIACFDVGGSPTLTAECHSLCNLPIAPEGRLAGFDFVGYTKRVENSFPEACPNYPSAEREACSRAGGVSRKDAECRDVCSVPIAFSGEVTGYSFTAFVQTLAPNPGQLCPSIATPELIACQESGGVAKKTFECKDLCTAPMAPVCG